MSGSIGFPRAALHLGGLWALAFAQPLFDLLGRNAQFFVARGSTTRRHPAARVRLRARAAAGRRGGRLGARAGSGRRSAGRRCSCSSRCSSPALLLPPAGDAARRLGGRDRRRAARSARAPPRCTRARAGVRSFADGALPRAADRAAAVPRRLAGARPAVPGDAGGAVAGPSRSSTPIVHVVLDELPQSTLANADGEIDAELFPNLARLARGVDLVPQRDDGRRPHDRGGARAAHRRAAASRARCRRRATIRAACSRCSSAATT